jgi:hypothetical protein
MKTSVNQQLVGVSKTLLVISRALLGVLIFIMLAPWIFPKSAFSWITSLYSFAHLIDAKDLPYFFEHISLLSQFLGVLGSFISLFPLLMGAVILIKLAKNYIRGEVFNLFNARAYRRLGWLYLLSAVFLQPLAQVCFSLSISFIHEHIGQKFIAISIDANTLTQIFFAMVLIIIGHVMQLAQNMQEEQALTI